MAKKPAAIKATNEAPAIKAPVEVKEDLGDGTVKTTTNELQQATKDGTMPRKKGNWVKMNQKQVEAHQEDHTLIGHDPSTGEGLLPAGVSVIDIKEE